MKSVGEIYQFGINGITIPISIILVEEMINSLKGIPLGSPISLSRLDGQSELRIPWKDLDRLEFEELTTSHEEMRIPFDVNFEGHNNVLSVNPYMRNVSLAISVEEVAISHEACTELMNFEINKFQPNHAFVQLMWTTRKFARQYFLRKTITPNLSILSWLHYFSPSAIEQHKLQKLFENPHLTVIPVGEGHLFQVLEDPFEINTPEGEAKVIAANQWMLDH